MRWPRTRIGLARGADRSHRLVVLGRAADGSRTSRPHCDVHLEDDLDEASKGRALTEVKRLGDEPGVERLTVGTGVGGLKTDYDWILDLQALDIDATHRLVTSNGYRHVMRALSAATKYEWTARLST